MSKLSFTSSYGNKSISIVPTKKLVLYPNATPAKAAAIPARGFLPLKRNSNAPKGIRAAYPTSFTILEKTANKNSKKVIKK